MSESSKKWHELHDTARSKFSIPNDIDLSTQQNIFDVFQTAVKQYANRPAFSCLGKTLSFSEVDTLSLQFANYLTQKCGMKPGDAIAIQLPNILQYPVTVFAAIRAGLVIVNTNPLYTPREMEHQFNDSKAMAVVVLANMASKVEEVLDKTALQHVIVTEMGDLHSPLKRALLNFVIRHVKKIVPHYMLPKAICFRKALLVGEKKSKQNNNVSAYQAALGELAVLQYTGGTTGVAKGAMLSHKNLIANMLQVYPVVRMAGVKKGEDVFIAPLPLYHIYAFMLHLMTAFSWGCHTVLIPNPRDIPAFIKDIKKWPFHVMVGLNTLFIALMNNKNFSKIDFTQLKITLSGGMALSESVAQQWKVLTKCEVVEGYGLTETSPVVSLNPPGDIQLGSIGLPLPSTYVRTVNDDGIDCAFGEAGELWVKGPQVMIGYWQRQAATDEVLKEGWLATGDMAIIQADGFIKIVDRKKDLIIVSGFNVYPNELENVINAHPDVLESAVIGIPDEHSGEAVKVFIVKKNPSLSVEDVKAYCVKNLTGYKRPKKIEFREELPKSNVGKILRRALRD